MRIGFSAGRWARRSSSVVPPHTLYLIFKRKDWL